MPLSRDHLTLLLPAVLLVAGCLDAPVDLPPSAGTRCDSCHGEGPPPGVWLGAGPGVGAHRAHLEADAIASPVACADCHLVPEHPDAEGHMDSPLPAEVTLGGLASARGFSASYDVKTRTCRVYCHGLEGGGVPRPSWTGTSTRMVCGSCHGLPPYKTLEGKLHGSAALESCENCHPSVVNASGAIIAPDKHVNGTVDK
jgi:predicted CxxxxCH...CXXCH cytochrome family protein